MSKLILLLFVVYTVGVLISNQVKANKYKNGIAELDEQIVSEQQTKKQLEQIVRSDAEDKEYLVQEAQNQGYAAPDERIFVDISAN